jgi:hypothetical protein
MKFQHFGKLWLCNSHRYTTLANYSLAAAIRAAVEDGYEEGYQQAIFDMRGDYETPPASKRTFDRPVYYCPRNPDRLRERMGDHERPLDRQVRGPGKNFRSDSQDAESKV